MRILIIEDEAPAFRRLQNILSQHHPDFEIVDVLDSVSESLKWFQNHQPPDLVFSDIQLSDGLSFDIYKIVRLTCPIIFTTAYDEYMLDAFKTSGIDYLLKPIEVDDLNRSVEKFKTLLKKSAGGEQTNISLLIEAISKGSRKFKDRFLVKVGTKLIPLEVGDIAYFYHAEGLTEIFQKNGKRYAIDPPLDELEKQLNPELFFRINRQFLCHMQSIGVMHQYFKRKLKVTLTPLPPDDAVLNREKARAFKNWMEGISPDFLAE